MVKGFTADSGEVKAVTLHWDPDPDPDVGGYVIYRIDETGKEAKIETLKQRTDSEYTDKGGVFKKLLDGQAYQYIIAAYNLFNAEGERTEPVEAVTKPLPDTVSALAAQPADNGVEVTWTKSATPDIANYLLQRSTRNNCTGFRVIQTIGADKTTFLDNEIEQGKHYCYKINAIDADALQSSDSSVVEIDIL